MGQWVSGPLGSAKPSAAPRAQQVDQELRPCPGHGLEAEGLSTLEPQPPEPCVQVRRTHLTLAQSVPWPQPRAELPASTWGRGDMSSNCGHSEEGSPWSVWPLFLHTTQA